MIRTSTFVQRKETQNISEVFKIGRKLGNGRFGEVRMGTFVENKNLPERAIKMLLKSGMTEEQVKMLDTEYEIMKQLDHPNVVKIFEMHETPNSFSIVTEYYGGGELYEYMEATKKIPEDEIRIILKTLLTAVDYCHKNNIVHRDLKPENILLENCGDPTQLKIIDFGLA